MYPTRNKEEVFGMAKGAKFITVLDLKDAFWSIPLPESLRKYFTFNILEGPLPFQHSHLREPYKHCYFLEIFRRKIRKH